MMKTFALLSSLLICLSCSTYKVNSIEKKYLLNEKGDSKYYLIELIRKAQSENKLGKEPMIIIDGTPIYYYHKEDFVPIKIIKDEVRKVEITESSKCVHVYGAACKYGLVTIKTNSSSWL